MSGGSFDYGYIKIDEYSGEMCDKELDELMKDIAKLCHDLEWWTSCDYSEEQYRESVIKFKAKWFHSSDRQDRLMGYADEILNKARKDIENIIGGID